MDTSRRIPLSIRRNIQWRIKRQFSELNDCFMDVSDYDEIFVIINFDFYHLDKNTLIEENCMTNINSCYDRYEMLRLFWRHIAENKHLHDLWISKCKFKLL